MASSQPDLAWLVFHSGKVRFGDGLPLTEAGAVGLPMPACWHSEKHGKVPFDEERMRLNTEVVDNLRHSSKIKQPKALPDRAVGRDGSIADHGMVLKMRTAIDASRNIRREAALFGYEALRAGRRFAALLEADDDVPAALVELLRDALKGTMRLGRLRQTEYGGVRCDFDTTPHLAEELAPPPGADSEGVLVLWLLSDLALEDERGRPILGPTARDLHPNLPAVPFDPTKSFIRARRYSPYNGYLRCHDVERVAIARGSVLCYEASVGFDPTLAAGGIGLYRECGLGRVWINPTMLAFLHPHVDAAIARVETPAAQGPAGWQDDAYVAALAGWVENRALLGRRSEQSEQAAREWATELEVLYVSGRELAGVPEGVPFGPTPSQWGRMLELAQEPRLTPQLVQTQLFLDENKKKPPICPIDDAEWSRSIGLLNDQPMTFRAWLKMRIDGWSKDRPATFSDLALILGRVAVAGRRIAGQYGNRRSPGPQEGMRT